MDLIDKKILKELFNNSRMHLSLIGKKVRLSRENVYYRIQSLVKKGIIKDFVASIDHTVLGFEQYGVFFEFDKIDKEKEAQIIEYLKKQNNLSWMSSLGGTWGLVFDIFAKTNSEVNYFISQFFNKFGPNIGEYIILNLQESNYFFNKIIGESVEMHPVSKNKIKSYQIDKIDKEILRKLNKDAKISYVDLSYSLKLTPNAIKNRILNLEKNKIILGYSISINHKQFGLEWHGLQIRLKRPSEELENNLKSYFRSHKKVIFYYHYNKSGIYDFDIGVVVKDSLELRDFMNELRKNFYNEIKIYDTYMVLEEVLSHKLPKIIFS